MKLVRVGAVALRQYYLVRGSPVRVLPLVGWVTLDVTLWGFISKYLGTFSADGLSFVPKLLGAVVLWDFLMRVMQGFTIGFLEDVWSRNFLNMFASPISIPEYLSGLIVTTVVTSSLGLAAMIVLAGLAFGVSMASLGIFAAPLVLVLFVFGVSLGIAATALVMRLGPAGEWLVWPIPAVLAPFAGVYYPVSTLPTWMHPVSRVIPPSYVFESLRAVLAGQTPAPGDVGMAVGLAIVWLLAACGLFTLIFRHVVKTGLIARYSAETVN
jgi:ABC-2 type transport system permease protein